MQEAQFDPIFAQGMPHFNLCGWPEGRCAGAVLGLEGCGWNCKPLKLQIFKNDSELFKASFFFLNNFSSYQIACFSSKAFSPLCFYEMGSFFKWEHKLQGVSCTCCLSGLLQGLRTHVPLPSTELVWFSWTSYSSLYYRPLKNFL